MRPFVAGWFAAAAFCASIALAQDAVPVPTAVLVIDREAVLLRSRTGQDRLTALADDERALAGENRAIEADLTAEEADLAARRSDMDPGAFREEADDFDRRVTAIRETQDAKERVLLERRQRLLDAFRQEMLPVLGEIMEERQAGVMLDRDAVLIFAATVDVTDEVIRRLDAALPDEDASDTSATTAANPAPKSLGTEEGAESVGE